MAQLGLRKAEFWEEAEGGRLHCLLCPNDCRIAEGETGVCRVRENFSGVLRSLNYGRVSALHMDPIEKKPLFHFQPGSTILSLGTVGCNLACAFCQNWSISQATSGTRRLSSEEVVQLALGEAGNIGIAYTYNEPFVWYEFVAETAPKIKEAGLHNVLVTNGYVSEPPLRELLPHIAAMNVDIKSMSADFYRELCRGRPEHPRRTVEIAHEAGCHVEVTNLLIPNWNDDEHDIRALIDWIAGISVDIPLHFSRYHPDHKLSEPPTPADTLVRAREMALDRLHYVYIGNVWGGSGEDTRCPSCGRVVVARRGFTVLHVDTSDGECKHCGSKVNIVGD